MTAPHLTAPAQAAAFLRDLLADGPVPARVVRRRAAVAGHSVKTLDKAKAAIGARSRFEPPRWVWFLPAALDPAPDPLADLDLDGADDRLAAIDGVGSRAGRPRRAARCCCDRPAVERDGTAARCVLCGRAVR